MIYAMYNSRDVILLNAQRDFQWRRAEGFVVVQPVLLPSLVAFRPALLIGRRRVSDFLCRDQQFTRSRVIGFPPVLSFRVRCSFWSGLCSGDVGVVTWRVTRPNRCGASSPQTPTRFVAACYRCASSTRSTHRPSCAMHLPYPRPTLHPKPMFGPSFCRHDDVAGTLEAA